MIATLLLRLQGPMQSWGSRSRFSERDTEKEPTKSGVVGLVCAALGRPRCAPLDDLRALRMGVRVDREGVLRRDFQTAQGVLKANETPRQLAGADLEAIRQRLAKATTISNRYYLADGVFLVGLEGDRTQLTAMHRALRQPTWPLFLGRKSFVPSAPVYLRDGLVDAALEGALRGYPWLGPDRQKGRPEGPLRTVIEVEFCDDGMPRKDEPASFLERTFVERRVRHGWVDMPAEALLEDGRCT